MKRLLTLLACLFLFTSSGLTQVQSPDEYLGFPLGADRELADYDQIVDYLQLLDQASPKLKNFNLGKTTDGNEMIITVISSEENMSRLEDYKKISRQLANPDGINSEEAEKLIQQGKVMAFITNNIHSTEIGASQMAMEFAYELITRGDDEVKFYLENVILVMMPSANPDGQLMVTDWYRKWVGTKYEGGRMPWLYHRYVGHDTNRDFYMLNLKESKMINRVMSQEWFPQVHLDEHQMGGRGPRMFVPPYKDPMSPNLSPFLMRLEALYGSNMSFRLEEKNMAGVIDSWAFDSYWPGGTRTAAWKNIVSLLTEMASCRIASPVYIEENELSGGRKGMAEYKQQVNFPNPWQGGWWRLRDIIDYELVASYAFLETSAKFRESILRGFYQMNLDAIKTGEQEPPFAFIIPTYQHDQITAVKMIELLLEHGIRVYQSTEKLVIDGHLYPEGSYIVPLAQPLRSFINEMLDVQRFPEIRMSRGSDPLYPYDVTSWTLPLLMNVRCEKIERPFDVEKIPITEAVYPIGKVEGSSKYGYAIKPQFNNTNIAVNRLLKDKAKIFAATEKFVDGKANFQPGTILLPAVKNISTIEKLAKDLHLTIHALQQPLPKTKKKLSPVRVGLYKPWRASMDEGWTRLLLERFEFNLVSVTNEMIKEGNLKKYFDALIIPDVGKSTILNPKPKDPKRAKYYRPFPDKYEGGIGKEGVKALKAFVKKGGTLITLDSGCQLAIDEFAIPVSNALENVSRSEFRAPGVMLKNRIDTNHPIGWGMPEIFAAFVSSSPAFRTSTPMVGTDRTVVATYPDEELLLSGWIHGEKLLRKKVSIVDVKYGEGKIILLGFRVQHRAQPHGTFKILFNSIAYAGMQ